MTQTGEVQVDSHYFLVATDSADTLNPRATGSLIEVGDDYLRFLTGAVCGPVTLSIEVVDEMPDITDADREAWEVIEETSMKITHDLRVLDGGLDVADGFSALGLKRGAHHVRGYARVRDELWDEIATEATEHYRVLIAKSARKIRLKQLMKTDAVWSAPVTFHQLRQWYEPDPASDASAWIHIGREAYIEEQKEIARSWGGRPPSDKLRGLSGARSLAFYDRVLADAISRAKNEKQDAIAQWAVRDACIALGLSDHAWAAPYIAALEDNSLRVDMDTFESYDAIDHLLSDNPEVDGESHFLPVPGGPTQGYGLDSLLRAVNRDRPQGGWSHAVFSTVEMAMTLAPKGHLDLILRLRREFFPRLKRADLYERWV